MVTCVTVIPASLGEIVKLTLMNAKATLVKMVQVAQICLDDMNVAVLLDFMEQNVHSISTIVV